MSRFADKINVTKATKPPVVNPIPEPVGGGRAESGYNLTQLTKARNLDIGSDMDRARQVNDELNFCVMLYKRAFPVKASMQSDEQIARHFRSTWRKWEGTPGNAGLRKAVDTSSTPAQEWVFTGFSNRLEEVVWSNNVATEAMRERPWEGNGVSFQVPILGAESDAVSGSENTSDTPSGFTEVDPNSDNATFSQKKLEARTTISNEALLAGQVDAEAYMMIHEQAHVNAIEEFFFNGDDSGTHQDYDTEQLAANVAAKRGKGLVYDALNVTGGTYNNGGAPVTAATIGGMLKKLTAKYQNRGMLRLILSPNTDADFVTGAALIGSGTTAATGMDALSRVLGFQGIHTSTRMRDNVAGTGVNVNGGTNTFSRILLFHYLAYAYSRWIDFSYEANPEPKGGAIYLISSQHLALQKTVNAGAMGTGDVASVLGINIAT